MDRKIPLMLAVTCSLISGLPALAAEEKSARVYLEPLESQVELEEVALEPIEEGSSIEMEPITLEQIGMDNQKKRKIKAEESSGRAKAIEKTRKRMEQQEAYLERLETMSDKEWDREQQQYEKEKAERAIESLLQQKR